MPRFKHRRNRTPVSQDELFIAAPSRRRTSSRTPASWSTGHGIHGTSLRIHEHHCRQAEYEQLRRAERDAREAHEEEHPQPTRRRRKRVYGSRR